MRQFRLGQLALVTTLAILVCRFIAQPETAAAQSVTALNFGSPAHGRPKAVDPGPRGGAPGAGGPLTGVGVGNQQLFAAARARFQEIDSVSGTMPGETGVGLGPRFNLNGCAGCHAFPTVGGSSPTINPQITIATLDGAENVVPSFITMTGPVREARFVRNPDGTPDGGVHDLFVISGRTDATGCRISQPDFAAALAQHNVIFRIPTPLFGLGLVENVPDNNLKAAQNEVRALAESLGIRVGVFNRSANDGTITRFGWKAQNKSLLMFAGEAYNVEQGVTNELFPTNGRPIRAANITGCRRTAPIWQTPSTAVFPPQIIRPISSILPHSPAYRHRPPRCQTLLPLPKGDRSSKKSGARPVTS